MNRINIFLEESAHSEADALIVLARTALPGAAALPSKTLQKLAAKAPTAGAVLLPGHAAQGPQIICVNGPVWTTGTDEELLTLRSSIETALGCAQQNGYTHTDLLAVNTGSPLSKTFQLASIVLKTIRAFCDSHDMPKTIGVMCCNQPTANLYKQCYNYWFAAERSDRFGSEDWEDWKR